MADENDTKSIVIQVDEASGAVLRTGATSDDIDKQLFEARLDALTEQMMDGSGSSPGSPSLDDLVQQIEEALVPAVAVDQQPPGAQPPIITPPTSIVGPDGEGGMGVGLIGAIAPEVAAIVVAAEAAIDLLETMLGVLQDIDEHFLSLADDIRNVSGAVQVAEAEASVMQLMAMMRRDQAIGADLGSYIRERAELDRKMTDFITAVEADLIPLALSVLRGINVAADILDNPVVKDNWFQALRFIPTYGPLIADTLMVLLPWLRKKKEEADADLFKEIDEFLAGAGDVGPGFMSVDVGRFPFAAGVFD
jgi:hypothetical protein